MWFEQSDAFRLVQFRLKYIPDLLLKRSERSELYPSPMHFGWSFQDRIAIPSEQTPEVTRCKQALKLCYGIVRVCPTWEQWNAKQSIRNIILFK